MTLGASTYEIVEFAILLLLGMAMGLLYIVLFLVRTCTKSACLRFIYDLSYAIMVAGVFVAVMLGLNMLSIRYYHPISLMMGILLVGVLPTSYLRRYENVIYTRFDAFVTRVRSSRLYRIIKK